MKPMRYGPALLAAGLALGACSGGGGSPAPAPVPQPSAPHGSSGDVRFQITIPRTPAASASNRRPAYVSAATASIVVSVAGASGGSASATVDVGSSACTSNATSIVCTASIAAPVGSDTFSVTTYQGTGGTGAVLSTGTIVQTILGTSANVVPIVLNGVVASLAITFANPYLPVIDGGTTTATIVARDAARDIIIGTYATPITLAAAAGLTPAPATLTSSSQAAVGVTYDGVSRSALSLTATSGPANASASIVPTTHLHIYTAPAKVAGGSVLFPILRGPDGAIYFGDVGPSQFFNNGGFVGAGQTGYVGRVDPASGTIAQVALAGIDPAGLIFVGNDLYIAESVTGTLGRIVGAASGGFSQANYSQLTLPNAPPPPADSNIANHAFPRRFAYTNGILYVTSFMDGSIDEVPVAQWTTGTSAVTRVIAPKRGDTPNGITLGNDGNLYFDGGRSRGVDELVPGSTTITDTSDPIIANDPARVTRFIATAADGTFYLSATPDAPATDGLESFDGTTFTELAAPTPLLEQQPDGVHPGLGTTIVFNDLFNGAGGVYDTSTNEFRLYPTSNGQFSTTLSPTDIADGLDGSYWYSLVVTTNGATTGLPNVEVGRLVLAQGWQLLPETPITIDGLGPAGAKLIAVAEAASSHDTVTVTSATPAICSLVAPGRYLDTYVVQGLAAGGCTITATDQTGRSQSLQIPVAASSLSISARGRFGHAPRL